MSEKLTLSRLGLKNFKNIKLENSDLCLNNLNILIGPNGSGKSNFISILKFIKEASTISLEKEKGVTEFESSVNDLSERILDATIDTPKTVSFAFDFSPTATLPKGLTMDLELLIKGALNLPIIRREALSASPPSLNASEPFFYYIAHERESGMGRFSVYNDESKKNSHFENLENIPVNRLALSAISELLENSHVAPESAPVYPVRRQMIDTLSNWRFYNSNAMNLENIRESEPKIGPSDIFLSPSGENLPIVFDNLSQNDVDFGDTMTGAMADVLPKTRKIRAARSGRLRLAIEWYMDGIKERFYLNDMSDGTVRMLCWAVILLSPELPSLLVIDEPEIGLHPAWMKTLSEWIKMASERSQVIITTHSPDLLDHFSDRYENVICFESNGDNHFTPKNLNEDKLKPMFEDGWQLGDIYRVGDPSIGGWPW